MEGENKETNQVSHSFGSGSQDFDIKPAETSGSFNIENPSNPIEVQPQVPAPPVFPKSSELTTDTTPAPSVVESVTKDLTTDSTTDDNELVYRAAGKTIKETQKKKLKLILIFAGIAIGLISVGGITGYYIFFSPKALAKVYYSKLNAPINRLSDWGKKGEELDKKLSAEGLKFDSATLQQKEMHSKFAEGKKFGQEYCDNFEKSKIEFEKMGKKTGNLSELYNDLNKYFQTGDPYCREQVKLFAYFEQFTSIDDWQKFESFNYYDYSKENLKNITTISEKIRLKMTKVDVPKGYEKFDKFFQDLLYLMESYGREGNAFYGAVENGNRDLAVMKANEILKIAADIQKLEQEEKGLTPDVKYYDDNDKFMENQSVKVNEDLKKISDKYKFTPLKIYIPKDTPTGSSKLT